MFLVTLNWCINKPRGINHSDNYVFNSRPKRRRDREFCNDKKKRNQHFLTNQKRFFSLRHSWEIVVFLHFSFNQFRTLLNVIYGSQNSIREAKLSWVYSKCGRNSRRDFSEPTNFSRTNRWHSIYIFTDQNFVWRLTKSIQKFFKDPWALCRFHPIKKEKQKNLERKTELNAALLNEI